MEYPQPVTAPDTPTDAMPLTPPAATRSIGQWVWAALGLVVLGLALWGIKTISGQVTWAEIVADIQATPTHYLVLAALSAAMSYVVLVLYDWLAVRHLGYKVGWPTLAAASFGSFTMSHALGLTVLTGGTVRYRIYTRAGIKPLDIALIIALCGWTFWLGIIVVAGVGLLAAPDLAEPLGGVLPDALKPYATVIKDWFGAILLAGAVAYTVTAWLWRKAIRLYRYQFYLPDLRETLLQIGIGVIDLAFAGAALYLLLPDAGAVDLLTWLTIYAVAMVAGALSHAPGGLGVFELVVVALLPESPRAGVLAALVLFRVIYTYIPFALGLCVIGWSEFTAFRARRRGVVQPAAAAP